MLDSGNTIEWQYSPQFSESVREHESERTYSPQAGGSLTRSLNLYLNTASWQHTNAHTHTRTPGKLGLSSRQIRQTRLQHDIEC